MAAKKTTKKTTKATTKKRAVKTAKAPKAEEAPKPSPVPTYIGDDEHPLIPRHETLIPTFQQDLATRDEAIRALCHSMNTEERRVIVTADEAPNPYMLRRPTSIIEMDIDLGGGFPAGGCCFISGPDNSGKTWLMLKAMAMQQKLYGHACRIVFALAEGAFPFDQAVNAGLKIAIPDEIIEQWGEWRRLRGFPPFTETELLGFKEKVGEFYIIRGNTGEEILQTMLDCVRTNAFSMIGCDSLNGLQPSIDAEKAIDKFEMRAAHATMLGKFFKKYIPITTGLSGLNQTTVIFTQQVRANQERANAAANVQKYMKPYAIAGGYAARHYKLIDLMMWDGAKIRKGKDGGPVIGKRMNWLTEKGKAGTHDNRQGDVAFYYHLGGADTTGELITSALQRGVLAKYGTKWKVARPDTGAVLEDFTAPSQKSLRRMLDADFEFELAFRREVLQQAGIQCLYR